MADEYRDLRIGVDRDIVVDGKKDIPLTEGFKENISQSIAIHCGDQMQELIGGPITSDLLQSISTAIKDAVELDAQIEEVLTVSITEIDEINSIVTVQTLTLENGTFTIPVQL